MSADSRLHAKNDEKQCIRSEKHCGIWESMIDTGLKIEIKDAVKCLCLDGHSVQASNTGEKTTTLTSKRTNTTSTRQRKVQ